jgi:hypothetical protein
MLCEFCRKAWGAIEDSQLLYAILIYAQDFSEVLELFV